MEDCYYTDKLLDLFNSGFYSLAQLKKITGLEFWELNQIMRDRTMELLNEEQITKIKNFVL